MGRGAAAGRRFAGCARGYAARIGDVVFRPGGAGRIAGRSGAATADVQRAGERQDCAAAQRRRDAEGALKDELAVADPDGGGCFARIFFGGVSGGGGAVLAVPVWISAGAAGGGGPG